MTTDKIVDENGISYHVSHRKTNKRSTKNIETIPSKSVLLKSENIVEEMKRYISYGCSKDVSKEQLEGELHSQKIAINILSSCNDDLETAISNYKIYTAFCHDMSKDEHYEQNTYKYGLYLCAVFCLTIMSQRCYIPIQKIVLDNFGEYKIDTAVKYNHFNELM